MVKRGLRKTYRAPTRRKRPITIQGLADMVRAVDMEELQHLEHTVMAFLGTRRVPADQGTSRPSLEQHRDNRRPPRRPHGLRGIHPRE